MPVTKDQAQILATLAVACRPARAPTWDEAGVLANIAKIKDRSLAEVVLAVIRAAADREAISPGIIPSNGSHWQEQLKPAKWAPEKFDRGEACTTCSQSRDRCRTIWADDHEFVSVHDHAKRVAEGKRNVPRIVEELRAERQPLGEPTPLPDLKNQGEGRYTERVAELRAELTATPEAS